MVAQLIDRLVCLSARVDSPKGCKLAVAFIRIAVWPSRYTFRSVIRSARLDTPPRGPKEAIDVPGVTPTLLPLVPQSFPRPLETETNSAHVSPQEPMAANAHHPPTSPHTV